MMFRTCVFLSLVLMVASEHPTSCPPGYKQLDDHCFLLMAETTTFFEGTVACDVIDGKLVQLTSQEDQTRVEKYLASVGASLKTDVWLGAQDLQVEGTWRYLSHDIEDALSTWSNWAPNSPKQDKGSNCATLNQGSRWQWIDTPCSYHHQVLCEVTLRLDDVVG